MQMNAKLIQYSLDLKYSNSKRIQSQHIQHLKKLQQITSKSNFPKMIKQVKNLKDISQSMNKFKQISRNFKERQIQQKRVNNDIKMIRSLSQINRTRKRLYTENQLERTKYKQRKQSNNRIIHMLKNKQLEEENLKIAMRLQRHEKDQSYKQKMKKAISQYEKNRKNCQKIRQDSLTQSMFRNKQKKKKFTFLLTLTSDNQQEKLQSQFKNQSNINISYKNNQKQINKCYTEVDQNSNQYVSSLSTKEIIAILNQKKQKQNKKMQIK